MSLTSAHYPSLINVVNLKI